MDDMIGYIFGSLKNSEEAIRLINKVLVGQTKINKYFTFFAVVSTVSMYFDCIERNKQKKKIEELTKEIEELKLKGE